MENFFESEKDLVAAYTNSLARSRSKSNSWTQEFDCANGIADVVLFSLRKDWKRQSGLGAISPRWAFALFSLPYRKQFSTSYLAERSGATIRTVTNILKEFENAGYCQRSNKTSELWIKYKQPTMTTNRVVAIEAKLKNWQRALKQAYRYLDYANQSWVLLDKKHSPAAIRNIEEFKRLNIGLKIISTDQKIEIIWTPSQRSPKSKISTWQASASLTKLALQEIY
ncbi:hypothetical protein ACNKU7_04570 [Microbulbifer sp. SA54]|uniref:hypothetical protein n=1 Tax=Microbulbifer sp. SA54 TaxID=3401577 RepID=UPI003AB002D7